MTTEKSNWREQELSLQEVIDKYPDVSPFVILKTDVQRRGVDFTQRAVDAVDPDRDAVLYRGIYTEKQDRIPNGLILRDGTTIIADRIKDQSPEYNGGRDPYLIDIVEGKAVLTDEGKVVEEISYWPKPDYFDRFTSSGTPMWQVLVARPQRMDINFYQNCDFWKLPGQGCKFCVIAATYHSTEKSEILNFQDIAEAVAEALKQKGRFRMIQLCSGSLLGGDELLDDEVNKYLELLKLLAKNFRHEKVMTQLIGTAYNERQLRRLYDETILTGYTADIEVLDEDIFNWICPGKAKYIGYEGWKERLYKAAEIFGPGAVNTGIVSGVELAAPNGFRTEEEALEKGLAEAEVLAQHGVGIAQTIYRVVPGSYFHKQKAASLDYLTAFAKGLDTIQRKYRLEAYFDDYRTCGNHPNTDLARI
ncbi:MAG TPA: radical SAM protein [Anaerovoracaceae bacterium]|nr:radical SAM protein [Anaerovoracaceae bacterium]